MTRFRFSLLGLAVATAAIALGCAALVRASPLVSSLVWGATLLTLTLVLLCAILSKPAGRGFWIGFATVGWLYALIAYGPLSDLSNVASVEPLLKRGAAAMPQSKKLQQVTISDNTSNTSLAYATLVEQILVLEGTQATVTLNADGSLRNIGLQTVINAEFVESFVRISQAFLALLLGILGGVAGHFIRRRAVSPEIAP